MNNKIIDNARLLEIVVSCRIKKRLNFELTHGQNKLGWLSLARLSNLV